MQPGYKSFRQVTSIKPRHYHPDHHGSEAFHLPYTAYGAITSHPRKTSRDRFQIIYSYHLPRSRPPRACPTLSVAFTLLDSYQRGQRCRSALLGCPVGNLEVATRLLEKYGANIGGIPRLMVSFKGHTALHFAGENGHTQMITLLLKMAPISML
jgi:hypothetical protein